MNDAGGQPADAATGGPATAELGVAQGPFAGNPIGSLPDDQSAQQQPADSVTRAGASPPDLPRADSSVGPPPTIHSSGTGPGPLQSVNPSNVTSGPLPRAATPAPGVTAPQPARSGRRVRISVSDQPGTYGTTPPPVSPPYSPSAAPTTGMAVRSMGGGQQPGPTPYVGAPRAGNQDRGYPRPTVATDGRTGQAVTTRATAGAYAAQGAYAGGQPTAMASVAGGQAGRLLGAPAFGGTPLGAAVRPTASTGRGGTASLRVGRPSVAASASSAAASGRGNADDLRSQAQRAWSSGRKGDARALYRGAIEGYRSEANQNPGRAGTSQSSIESCRRALDAMDASQ